MGTENLRFLESVVKMPLMALPVRSPLITVGERRILISPGSRLTQSDYDAIEAPTDIVAPSLFHSAGVLRAAQAFPRARIWAAPGLRLTRKNIPWTDDLDESNWPFKKELPMVLLAGAPKINEVVFFHRESKSLIISDLVFNMKATGGLGAWIILKLFGTYRRLGMSRFFARFIADRQAFENSLNQVFDYDFENLVVSHGDNVTSAGKERLLAAVRERGFLKLPHLPADINWRVEE